MNKKHIRFDVDSDLYKDFKSKLIHENKKASDVLRRFMVDYIDTYYDIEKVNEYGLVFDDESSFPASLSDMKSKYSKFPDYRCFVFRYGKMIRYETN